MKSISWVITFIVLCLTTAIAVHAQQADMQAEIDCVPKIPIQQVGVLEIPMRLLDIGEEVSCQASCTNVGSMDAENPQCKIIVQNTIGMGTSSTSCDPASNTLKSNESIRCHAKVFAGVGHRFSLTALTSADNEPDDSGSGWPNNYASSQRYDTRHYRPEVKGTLTCSNSILYVGMPARCTLTCENFAGEPALSAACYPLSLRTGETFHDVQTSCTENSLNIGPYEKHTCNLSFTVPDSQKVTVDAVASHQPSFRFMGQPVVADLRVTFSVLKKFVPKNVPALSWYGLIVLAFGMWYLMRKRF